VKTEEEDDEDLVETPPEVVDDCPIEDERGGGNVDTICEDVSVAVTGKKNIRGKVWRARNGDYVRYLCVDDGADYRPGGMFVYFFSRFYCVKFAPIKRGRVDRPFHYF
jgi:hypothetical protein